eukprot:30655-Pelagococcus_subviridis.AAC.12
MARRVARAGGARHRPPRPPRPPPPRPPPPRPPRPRPRPPRPWTKIKDSKVRRGRESATSAEERGRERRAAREPPVALTLVGIITNPARDIMLTCKSKGVD